MTWFMCIITRFYIYFLKKVYITLFFKTNGNVWERVLIIEDSENKNQSSMETCEGTCTYMAFLYGLALFVIF